MTNSILTTAQQLLLEPAGLSEKELEKTLGTMLGHRIDYADLYFQSRQSESWSLEAGVVKEGSFSIDRGVGVRAISGEKTGFAYTDDVIFPALTQAAEAARSIAHQGKNEGIRIVGKSSPLQLYTAENPLQSMMDADKIALLHRVDQLARSLDPRVKQVMASLAATYDVVLVVNSEGHLAADIRPLVRLSVSVVVEEKGRRETGSHGGGGRFLYPRLIEIDAATEFTREAVREALVNLDAVDAPAGTMPVVLGAGWPGVLLHEAVGHGLEGDFNRKGSSLYSNRMNQRVASPLCTIVDDGTLADRRGSLSVDDEGTPTQRNVLIENGILRNYMQDKLNARLMGMPATGNGRRESYAHLPMPRMTNTYMLAGESDPEEMIRSVDKGLYAVNFSGGQVDITSGKFVFSASEAYLIEKGKVTRPVKGATLIGNGPDVLTKVSMVGHDLKLDKGVGTCGKEGQSVPVGVGQPTLKIEQMTVGGTK